MHPHFLRPSLPTGLCTGFGRLSSSGRNCKGMITCIYRSGNRRQDFGALYVLSVRQWRYYTTLGLQELTTGVMWYLQREVHGICKHWCAADITNSTLRPPSTMLRTRVLSGMNPWTGIAVISKKVELPLLQAYVTLSLWSKVNTQFLHMILFWVHSTFQRFLFGSL